MTIKTPGKNPQEQPDVGPSQQDLQAAYQVHTLAHMLYGQLATIYPWPQLQPFLPVPPMAAPPMMGLGATGPQMGPMAMPWTQTHAVGSPLGQVGPAGPASYPWAGYGWFGSQFFPR
jgi:hypothetical protein